MKKKIKNRIFNYLTTTNVGVNQFELVEDINIIQILLKDSPLKFIIEASPTNYDLLSYQFVPFSPSFKISDRYPRGQWFDFESVLYGFKDWINNHVKEYIEDNQEFDLWAEYNKENKNFNFGEIEYENQNSFSLEEKVQIQLALNDLKVLIHKSLETNEEEQAIINDRLDYLFDSVNRLNKFDWKSVAISTIFSISIALTLDTSKGQLLFMLFKQVFSVIPMLMK